MIQYRTLLHHNILHPLLMNNDFHLISRSNFARAKLRLKPEQNYV